MGGVRASEAGTDRNGTASSLEHDPLIEALEQVGCAWSKTAQLPGLDSTTLLEKIKKIKIETPS